MKTPRTDIRILGEIPPRLLDVLRSEYDGSLELSEDDDECVKVTKTAWYKETRDTISPGDVIDQCIEQIELFQQKRFPYEDVNNL